MDHFWTIFDQRWGSNVQQNATGSSTRHERARGLNADSQPAQSTTSHRKRLRDEDNEDQEDNENEDRRLKRLNPRPRDKLADALKFACLFRKHNPSKYSIFDHRSCALSSWRTIGRLKEHLFRTHRIAIHCGRCWVTFKTADQLNAHITVDAAIICQTKPGLPPEGISPDMERKLRSRKKSHPNQSDEDRWRDMYKLLFPDEEIPFPYFEELRDEAPLSPDSRDFTEYEAYARRELPRLVRSSVLEVFRRELQPVEASLVANLVNTIQDCQDRLFRSYVGRANLEDNTASARPREDLCTYPRNTNDGTGEAFENPEYTPSDFLCI
ncbi:hypothetical protein BKA65DRAFT_163081 [Rhexocercosporidium sp. MPI-PUGE-AT-0058]|nr:hypothetical protein BKA65DRAFT_163081 [Rhexocercosporidium sp. MPI-PUGE-AT-0058]